MKKHPDFPNLYVADHPLILHKLSLMIVPGLGDAGDRLFGTGN